MAGRPVPPIPDRAFGAVLGDAHELLQNGKQRGGGPCFLRLSSRALPVSGSQVGVESDGLSLAGADGRRWVGGMIIPRALPLVRPAFIICKLRRPWFGAEARQDRACPCRGSPTACAPPKQRPTLRDYRCRGPARKGVFGLEYKWSIRTRPPGPDRWRSDPAAPATRPASAGAVSAE